MTTITTTYIPPTDTAGSKFRATSNRPTRRQVTVPYDYGSTAFQNHYAVAVALADRIMPEWTNLQCHAGDTVHGPRGYRWELS